MVNYEMSEYRTVYVDVVFIKTDLPLKFVHFSPDNRDGLNYQNFTVQTFGTSSLVLIPPHCCLFAPHFRQRADQLHDRLRRWHSANERHQPTSVLHGLFRAQLHPLRSVQRQRSLLQRS